MRQFFYAIEISCYIKIRCNINLLQRFCYLIEKKDLLSLLVYYNGDKKTKDANVHTVRGEDENAG
jgi:hypothetical protein